MIGHFQYGCDLGVPSEGRRDPCYGDQVWVGDFVANRFDFGLFLVHFVGVTIYFGSRVAKLWIPFWKCNVTIELICDIETFVLTPSQFRVNSQNYLATHKHSPYSNCVKRNLNKVHPLLIHMIFKAQVVMKRTCQHKLCHFARNLKVELSTCFSLLHHISCISCSPTSE